MKQRILYSGLLIIFIGLIALVYLNQTLFLNEQKRVYDNLSTLLNTTIKNSKQELLNISATIAQTKLLKDAIIENNKEVSNAFLEQMNAKLYSTYKSNKLFVQVLTSEKLYGDMSNENTLKFPIKDDYIDNVDMMKNSKSTMVDVTAKECLRLKAISPIVEHERLLGFVEVSSLHDVMVQKLRAHHVELIPLLKQTLLPNKTSLQKSARVGNEYIVATQNYNHNLFNKLAMLLPKDMEQLLKEDFLYKYDLYFASFDIRNNRGVSLGKYIFVLNPESFEYYNNTQSGFLENIITMNNSSEDFYDYVKHKEENMFMSIEKGYIKNLKDVVDEKDKMEFEEVAREKLLGLSKEELVDFIMQQSKKSEIRGEIR